MSTEVTQKTVKGNTFHPTIKPSTRFTIEVVRRGKVIEREEKASDLVLNDGLNILCAWGFNPTQPPPANYTMIGTDSTAPAAGQSGLLAEVMRVSGAYSKDAAVGEASIDGAFSIAVSGYSLYECGLINRSGVGTSGVCYCRDTYTVKNVLSGDTVNLYYTASMSAA